MCVWSPYFDWGGIYSYLNFQKSTPYIVQIWEEFFAYLRRVHCQCMNL